MDYKIKFFDFPRELQEKILNSIKCEKTTLACRKTCTTFWKFFNVVNVYCEGIIIGKNFFSPEMFSYKDIEGNIIRKMVFRPYGMSKYFEYSPAGILIRTVESKTLFKTQMIDFTNAGFNRLLTCDSRYGLIKETNIPKLIHPGACTIS